MRLATAVSGNIIALCDMCDLTTCNRTFNLLLSENSTSLMGTCLGTFFCLNFVVIIMLVNTESVYEPYIIQ